MQERQLKNLYQNIWTKEKFITLTDGLATKKVLLFINLDSKNLNKMNTKCKWNGFSLETVNLKMYLLGSSDKRDHPWLFISDYYYAILPSVLFQVLPKRPDLQNWPSKARTTKEGPKQIQ